MGKRKGRSKRSAGSLPKGLPVRGGGSGGGVHNINPFETIKAGGGNKRQKHAVHNRKTQKAPKPPSALLRALQERQSALRKARISDKKANVWQDKRIGEYNREMSVEERTMARLVRERSRRSKRSTKYQLEDDGGSGSSGRDDGDFDRLTHKGTDLSKLGPSDHLELLSDDDEDDEGGLGAYDTARHFGSGNANDPLNRSLLQQQDQDAAQYGYYGSQDNGNNNTTGPSSSLLRDQYGTDARKMELDDLILRRKLIKAERLKNKNDQTEAFAAMDTSFKDLSALLNFRDKEEEIRKHLEHKRAGTLPSDDQEMADWDREMKQYQFQERKVKATERTKLPEEIAAERAARLHELETRRLARMQGDFDDDNLTDVSDDEDGEDDDNNYKTKRRRKRKRPSDNAEALDDDTENEYGDSDGDDSSEGISQQPLTYDKNNQLSMTKDNEIETIIVHKVGTVVKACYRAKEQFDGHTAWYQGKISAVHEIKNKLGNTIKYKYDVDYDDGDFENGVEAEHIELLEKTDAEAEQEAEKKATEEARKRKRRKAQKQARSDIPFVFEVPTTLEALHEMIAAHASTGPDVSLMIQRIHATHSVRLDRRNAAKMQNFTDVLIKRMVAVGDAVLTSGDGGPALGRYDQLDSLTQTLYDMAQDAPTLTAAVWSRRLGILWSAHAKRLRDAALDAGDGDGDEDNVDVEGPVTAWPSTGVFFMLRAVGHIFPVTDKRHPVVTPTLLYVGHVLAHTPVSSRYCAVMGVMLATLMIEFTKEAKRIAPEALAFLAGLLRLYASESVRKRQQGSISLPSLGVAATLDCFSSFRGDVSAISSGMGRNEEDTVPPKLSLEQNALEDKAMPTALLWAVLHLIETSASNLSGSMGSAEQELFAETTESLASLHSSSGSKGSNPFPLTIRKKIASTVTTVMEACQLDQSSRVPLQRRSAPSASERAIKSLAPRLENPNNRYSMSKDKGKNAEKAAADRTRREYKREHKAVARELRLDAAAVEEDRRQEKDKKDAAAKAKRHKAFAWLESEQGAMNQQVRQGGGLLSGGGMGAAKAKAASAKLGIKRGGKF